MPVLHLALDIDSDVYPELHAKLASLQRPEARAERLRQLAASGLVWETVRIHGPAAIPLPASLPAHVASPAAAAVSASAAASAPAASPVAPAAAEERAARGPAQRAGARSPAPSRASRAAPGDRARAPDFVDLAISVEPPQPSAPHKSAATNAATPGAAAHKAAAHERPPVPDHVPLLLDVVSSPVLPDPAFAAAGPSFDDGTVEPAMPEPPQPLTVVPRSAPRSRLLRMKERGLFKNG